jgi:hypothetical protein
MRRLLWYGNSLGSNRNPNSLDNPVCLSVQLYGTYCQHLFPNLLFKADTVGQLDLSIPSLYPSFPSLVTNAWLLQIIPKLWVLIAQELSADNAQEGLIVVRLHHSVQRQQQRVTDRWCLFRNPSHLPCSVSGIRNRFMQSNESIPIPGFTQSCLLLDAHRLYIITTWHS